jgi:hypothetical protein
MDPVKNRGRAGKKNRDLDFYAATSADLSGVSMPEQVLASHGYDGYFRFR